MSDPRHKTPSNGSPALGGLVAKGAVTAVKCHARTSSGRPCKRWAIVGGTVCTTHGGSAPQVRAAANRALMALAPRAIQVLTEIMDDPDAGAPSRVRAAIDVIDRTMGKAIDVTLDITPQEHGNGALDAAIANALAQRGLGPGPKASDAEVIDAEVIDPSDPS